ncbi:hypothetical protein ACFYP4_17275 [Streptomyces sp. NPDC005551]|uniref:hypothetical protein n=1 Tax=Streptomyces sp. NPDC005551 TaxID=3364725 RepID=UPI0036ABE1A1
MYRRRESFSPVRQFLLPVPGIAGFVPALLTPTGLLPAFDLVSELTAPVSYAGPVAVVWMMTGVLPGVLVRRRSERIADPARARLDASLPSYSSGLPTNGAVQP